MITSSGYKGTIANTGINSSGLKEQTYALLVSLQSHK